MNAGCPRCRAVFECKPEGGCWCMTLPPVMPVGSYSADERRKAATLSCLCPDCLKQIVELHARGETR
ncbi:MAG: cysteine-rich CWC family protein [Alphaproteobacteria bacterium]|jgi:hypothetical protein|nr:cysteine-rich CWC family protein [Alphaproteobacteria bacterium]